MKKRSNIKGTKVLKNITIRINAEVLEVLISGRFIVAVHGNAVSMAEIKSAIDQVDIGKLESMKEANPISE